MMAMMKNVIAQLSMFVPSPVFSNPRAIRALISGEESDGP
jgi:hypothetical protein